MGETRSATIPLDEALRCDPEPYEVPHPFDVTAPTKVRDASDVLWASISNSAAWTISGSFEDALAVGRNVIEALYAAGFVIARENGSTPSGAPS